MTVFVTRELYKNQRARELYKNGNNNMNPCVCSHWVELKVTFTVLDVKLSLILLGSVLFNVHIAMPVALDNICLSSKYVCIYVCFAVQ